MAGIFIVSGPSGTGKTTLCQNAIAQLRTAGARVAGLVSPPRMVNGLKTGILACDLRSGMRRPLARQGSAHGLGWQFDARALQWGNAVLQAAPPCDVLVVDEIGPLEIHRNMGWMSAWQVLAEGNYHAALIVVRPSLASHVLARLQDHAITLFRAETGFPTAEELAQAIILGMPLEKT